MRDRGRLAFGAVVFVLFVATVVAANWAIRRFGPVAVWPGIVAPAGVYFAGLAFTLRDLLHEAIGRVAVVAAIVVGAATSAAISTDFAVASGVAFLASEVADFAVYEPLRRRGWLRAVAASNLVGLVVDSALFLWLAFDSLEFLRGQVVGKVWVTALAVVALSAARGAGAVPRWAEPEPV